MTTGRRSAAAPTDQVQVLHVGEGRWGDEDNVLRMCARELVELGGDPFITFAEGRRGGQKIRPKCECSKGGCVNLVL